MISAGMATCDQCGKHPLSYIHCDRWDCPLLGLRRAQEMPDADDLGLIENDDDEVIEPHDYTGDYDLDGDDEEDDEEE